MILLPVPVVAGVATPLLGCFMQLFVDLTDLESVAAAAAARELLRPCSAN